MKFFFNFCYIYIFYFHLPSSYFPMDILFFFLYPLLLHDGNRYSCFLSVTSLLNLYLVPGTNLTERFHDQFSALLFGQSMSWSVSNSTIIRLPLSSEYMEEGTECASRKISLLFNKFVEHCSRTILFLNSIMQVCRYQCFRLRYYFPAFDFHVEQYISFLRLLVV